MLTIVFCFCYNSRQFLFIINVHIIKLNLFSLCSRGCLDRFLEEGPESLIFLFQSSCRTASFPMLNKLVRGQLLIKLIKDLLMRGLHLLCFSSLLSFSYLFSTALYSPVSLSYTPRKFYNQFNYFLFSSLWFIRCVVLF